MEEDDDGHHHRHHHVLHYLHNEFQILKLHGSAINKNKLL